jgi:ribosomal protein S18 acetylase RimI-like enzyme
MWVEIRDYADRDWEFVRTLFAAYLAEERGRVPVLGTADDFADTYLPQLIRRAREEDGLALIAEEEGVRCGFIAALPKEAQPWDPTRGKVAMVMEAHVDGRHRRRGIGRRLFAAVEERYAGRGVEWVTLGTFAGNVVAHAFYRAMGYRTTYLFMGKPLSRSR